MGPIKKKSKYSDHYDMKFKTKATCLKCGVVIQRSGGSTYGMKSHLKSQHDIDNLELEITIDHEKLGPSTSNPRTSSVDIISGKKINDFMGCGPLFYLGL